MTFMNRKALTLIASFCLMVFAVLATTSTTAAPAPRDQGIKAFKAKKYEDALAKLQSALQSNPNDDVAHYYLGLTYQYLQKNDQAQKEYEWVASNSSDAGLKKKAQSGLANLTKATGGKAPASSTTAKSTSPIAGGKPKVIEFSATWCGPCKRFAPTFDKVAGMFTGKIDIQKIDIDDKSTAQITDKYKVQAVPTIVFLDSKGNIVNQHLGGMNEQELTSTMQSLIGK